MKNEKHLPQFPLRLLRWFCSKEVIEFLLGDMEELYEMRLKRGGKLKARFYFLCDVLSAIRPFAFKNKWSNSINTPMIRHNMRITIRNFYKHKSQFLINLIGLSSGLTCVLFIYLWVVDEIKMDNFHENSESLYQIMSNHSDASGISTWKGVPGLLLEEIQSSIPGVKKAAASTDVHEYTISVGGEYHKVNGKFASQDFLEIFSFPLLRGTKGQQFSDNSGITITASLAERLFGTTDAIGRQIDWHFWGKEKTVVVTGILDDIPKHSSEKFDFLMSWNYYHDELIDYKNWGNYYGRIHVTLNPDTPVDHIDEQLTTILHEKQGRKSVELFLTKYSERYLHAKYENGKRAGGRIEYVHLFSVIAALILFIACVNFINLSTAKAEYRMKEIGVKKSFGASRRSLMMQYFTESVMLSTMSMIIALMLVGLLLPQFNVISHKQLSLSVDPSLLLSAFILILIVGVLAGSYPALYLSKLKTLQVIKGKLKRSFLEIWGRNALVTIQFTLSIILISSVIVVYQQMNLIKYRNLGFNRDNLVYFEREGTILQNSETFVNELKKIPGVQDAGITGFAIGGMNNTGGVSWDGKTEDDQVQFWEIRSGQNNLDLLGIQLIQGRDFLPGFGVDTAGVIFNETAIKAMGLVDPIGQKIRHYEGEKTIIGVVKDFNMISLHSPMEPMMFLYAPQETHFVMARIAKGNERQTLYHLQEFYSSFNPGFPFSPLFIDQDYQAQYGAEERVSKLAQYFAGFAILISCLGLFGLAAFTAERRIKEIGIRKVLGSGVYGIVLLLTRDFTRILCLSMIIAIPLSYFIASSWLENFAYRISLEWWFFVGSALCAIIIAWLTVGFQTYRSATVNPVKSLRME